MDMLPIIIDNSKIICYHDIAYVNKNKPFYTTGPRKAPVCVKPFYRIDIHALFTIILVSRELKIILKALLVFVWTTYIRRIIYAGKYGFNLGECS